MNSYFIAKFPLIIGALMVLLGISFVIIILNGWRLELKLMKLLEEYNIFYRDMKVKRMPILWNKKVRSLAKNNYEFDAKLKTLLLEGYKQYTIPMLLVFFIFTIIVLFLIIVLLIIDVNAKP